MTTVVWLPRGPLVRVAAVVLLLACAGAPSGPVERVQIPRGASFAEALDSLEAHGLLSNRLWVRAVGRVGGFHRSIRPGIYEFARGTSSLEILRALRDGRVVLVRFTVPEGTTLIDLARLAETRLGVDPAEVLARARDTLLLARHGIDTPTAEGYIAPDTYFLPGDLTGEEVVVALLEQFERMWRPSWDSAARARGLSRHDLLTMASIVEGEAQVDDERPVIAAVFLNRLRIGMPLQADPTVQYAIQQATGSRKPRLLNADYGYPSRYNTYLHPGLPPGPIGAPGAKSIEAVLAPAEVPYLYFVAAGDGRHVFSRTYPEHLRAVARVRSGR